MRTTVRIDDDLLRTLKKQAQQEQTSFSRLLNSLLRQSLSSARSVSRKKTYREKTYSMGVPTVDLTKALAIAAALEDEEILRKMALGK